MKPFDELLIEYVRMLKPESGLVELTPEFLQALVHTDQGEQIARWKAGIARDQAAAKRALKR